MPQSLYVGNLPYSATSDQLKDFFGQAGEVASATVITDKFSGRSKGFGFVEMADAAGASKAIADLNGQEMDGRAIRVSEARPKEERKPGGFGGR
ncbi:MAG: RNA-binding protein [bacterium]